MSQTLIMAKVLDVKMILKYKNELRCWQGLTQNFDPFITDI